MLIIFSYEDCFIFQIWEGVAKVITRPQKKNMNLVTHSNSVLFNYFHTQKIKIYFEITFK